MLTHSSDKSPTDSVIILWISWHISLVNCKLKMRSAYCNNGFFWPFKHKENVTGHSTDSENIVRREITLGETYTTSPICNGHFIYLSDCINMDTKYNRSMVT